ncbi:hypothetical protein [Mycobacterium sp. 852002-10029_SCH5224772]|uniref:hypothetical protein n=1 Tax=Mycobacterium sp. 852002-10029_SCH5224772 TaxID=1834083 RepID=UPI0018D3C558|nr:hypothetical protein [Mycobacterium sp. 852002-10029_SCH5224772]
MADVVVAARVAFMEGDAEQAASADMIATAARTSGAVRPLRLTMITSVHCFDFSAPVG